MQAHLEEVQVNSGASVYVYSTPLVYVLRCARTENESTHGYQRQAVAQAKCCAHGVSSWYPVLYQSGFVCITGDAWKWLRVLLRNTTVIPMASVYMSQPAKTGGGGIGGGGRQRQTNGDSVAVNECGC